MRLGDRPPLSGTALFPDGDGASLYLVDGLRTWRTVSRGSHAWLQTVWASRGLHSVRGAQSVRRLWVRSGW